MIVRIAILSTDLEILGEADVYVKFKSAKAYPMYPINIPIRLSGRVKGLICYLPELEATCKLGWSEEIKDLKIGMNVRLDFDQSGGAILCLTNNALEPAHAHV